MLKQLEPSAAWAHHTARRGSMTGRSSFTSARCAFKRPRWGRCMLTQLQPSAAWAHHTARRGSMTGRSSLPSARCASAIKRLALFTLRRSKRSKVLLMPGQPLHDNHREGVGGGDAHEAAASAARRRHHSPAFPSQVNTWAARARWSISPR